MTKNCEIAELIFNEIKKLGYKPYDIKYGNSYFIFNGYEDSVIHFRLKGLGLLGKHWKFGMWINSEYLDEKYREEEKELKYDEYYNIVQIFAQYDTQIDKFKPSVSSLCIKYKAYDWEKHINYLNPWHEIKSMLGMVKKHPFVCYSERCGEYAGYYDNSLILEFIKEESKNKIKKINEKFQTLFWLNYTKIKLFFAKKCKCINDIILYDFEKENKGWSTSYKYKILTTFKEDVSDEEMGKWVDFWFKKNKYGKYNYSYVIELGDFKQIGNDKEFYFNYD